MRLDHLLSREEVRVGLLLICQEANLVAVSECTNGHNKRISGGDALMGHTRSHPEHDG